MKSTIKLILAAMLVTPLFAIGIVSAQETPTTTTQQTTTPTPTTTEEKAALKQRLEKRKAEVKAKITAAEKTRIQQRCKNSQGKLSSLSGRIKGIETSRDQVYTNLIDRLTKLNAKLKEGDVDTVQFESQITMLEAQIATFKADLAAYSQAVSDLSVMDCADDAEAFKNSLEAARAAREKVRQDVTAIKAYVNETIKPTLKTLRDSVETTEGSTE